MTTDNLPRLLESSTGAICEHGAYADLCITCVPVYPASSVYAELGPGPEIEDTVGFALLSDEDQAHVRSLEAGCPNCGDTGSAVCLDCAEFGAHGSPCDHGAPDAAYYASLDAEAERARQRVGKDAPRKWGERLDEDTYFCTPCWGRGDEFGSHPFSMPPCDPIKAGER